MALDSAVVEIGGRIDELQQSISRQPWRNASRPVFVNSLEKSLDDLQQLYKVFYETFEEIKGNPKEGRPDLLPFLREMEKTIDVLEKNYKFEKQKKARAITVNVLEKEETPALYADLEQKILGMLLKARYSLERMSIFLRKEGLSPLTEKSTAKQVMQILERKEDELQSLREKYEDARKKTYLGYLEEETVADMEHDLTELGRRMALSADDLGKSLGYYKSQIEYIESNFAELKQKLDSLQEAFSAYGEKTSELIRDLKKERDYAKKIVLDVEHETLKLRNTYSKELLGLQESKLAAKQEAEKHFEAELRKLQKQLAEQGDLLGHFRKIAEDKLKKEHELEEKVSHLTLLLKTKEKHEAVKRQLLGKKGGKK